MNTVTKTITVILIVVLAVSSFMAGFTVNRSKKSYDFDNVCSVMKTENPEYEFLHPDLSDYICELSQELELDTDLVVAILMCENPNYDENAIHRNTNGTVDVGLFQLNDKYLWTDYVKRYWYSDIDFDPFNWKHNTYVALHHIQFLKKKLKVQDDVILAYNCGINAVYKRKIPNKSIKYLNQVKNCYWLLQHREDEQV